MVNLGVLHFYTVWHIYKASDPIGWPLCSTFYMRKVLHRGITRIFLLKQSRELWWGCREDFIVISTGSCSSLRPPGPSLLQLQPCCLSWRPTMAHLTKPGRLPTAVSEWTGRQVWRLAVGPTNFWAVGRWTVAVGVGLGPGPLATFLVLLLWGWGTTAEEASAD